MVERARTCQVICPDKDLSTEATVMDIKNRVFMTVQMETGNTIKLLWSDIRKRYVGNYAGFDLESRGPKRRHT